MTILSFVVVHHFFSSVLSNEITQFDQRYKLARASFTTFFFHKYIFFSSKFHSFFHQNIPNFIHNSFKYSKCSNLILWLSHNNVCVSVCFALLFNISIISWMTRPLESVAGGNSPVAFTFFFLKHYYFYLFDCTILLEISFVFRSFFVF